MEGRIYDYGSGLSFANVNVEWGSYLCDCS